MKHGTYIVIEGLDGSGKTTQFELARRFIGGDVVSVREPGGTPSGEYIRRLLKDKRVPRATLTNVLLFSAARAELVASVIRPALQAGQVVLSDRNWLSTLAYQGAEGEDRSVIVSLSRLAMGDLAEPDLLILLDASPEVCYERLRKRGLESGDYFETKNHTFFRLARDVYLQEVQRFPRHVIVDANGPADVVSESVYAAIANVL